LELENEVRAQGVTPATTAVLEGKIRVGLNPDEIEKLANLDDLRKISCRDFAGALASKASGGTTVSGTLVAAEKVGIRTFTTGGIGGVHRQPPFDISADLQQLGRSPAIVVCAGAKSILNLPATLEYLETIGVPVVGWQTNEFPAFYSRESGLPVSERVESAEEAAKIAIIHWRLGMRGAILVVVPPPNEVAIPNKEMDGYISSALEEAEKDQIRGQALTPYLLKKVSAFSQGKSLRANLSLLKNNARIGAQIAIQFNRLTSQNLA
jgi:pseudouridine-5'-phosphate glycosidase